METTTVVEGTAVPPELQKPLVPVYDEKKKNLKVLVAVDDSEFSFYALQWALDNLFKNSSAAETSTELSVQDAAGTITLVHILQPFQHYVFPAGPELYATNNVVESVRRARREIGSGIVGRALKLCTNKMVKAETLLLEGDAKDKICQATQELHVDLLVLGSRGHGMVKRALLGSVSDYCVHHAKCPVLIVKPPKESSHGDKKSKE